MSCTDSNKFSEPQVIKIDCSDEKVTVAGKPCIDFQPDDRWQIKDDENSDMVPNSSSTDLKSKTNDKQSRRLRNSKSCDSNSAINGEAIDSCSDDENRNNNDKIKETPIVVENHSKRKRHNSNSEAMPDCNAKKKVKIDEPDEANNVEKSSLKDSKPVSNDSTDNSSDKITMPDLSPATGNSNDKLTDGSSDKTKDVSDDKTKGTSDDETIGTIDNKTKNASDDKTKDSGCDESVEDAKENKDESVIIESGKDSKESDHKENKVEENDCEVIPTLDEEVKKRDTKSKGEVNGTSHKMDVDIEIINIHDDKNADSEESDSECQIINPEEEVAKKTSDLFKTDAQDTHYTLTAGFPYYNSLKEKMSNFKAGDYKPVKFPHTGTLLLGEKEVIIESPSLLVPLLIKEADEFPKLDGEDKKTNGEDTAMLARPNISKRNFFQSSVGQFLINLGMSRVQEWYHRDMKRSKFKQLKSAKGKKDDPELEETFKKHEKRVEELKEINAAFNFRLHLCKFCEFKTESLLVMEGHYLIPHLTPRREYRCNFCDFLNKDPGAIAQHYDKSHKKKAILDNYVTFHECVFCTFQSHLKNKVNAHMNRCRKHFIPSQNLSPPFDFEFPGVTTKPVTINDVIGHRRLLLSSAKNPRMPMPDDNNPNSIYARKKLASVLTKLSSGPNTYPDLKNPSLMKQLMTTQSQMPLAGSNLQLPPGLVITRPGGQVPTVRAPVNRFQGPRGLPAIRGVPPRRGPPYTTTITNAASQLASSGISITPVSRSNTGPPRTNSIAGAKNVTLTPISTATNRTVSQKPGPPQPVALFTNMAGSGPMLGQPQARLPANMHLRPIRPSLPYQRLNTPPSQVVKGSSGNTFVVCEICDSYIKDLEELRTHMNWVHKVKIHPKMLVSRPPLNCQKCHWRFFTDQGLERHLLGAHGLVTTNMQEMANKNQDGGRCIICGAVFTYKLVSHMTQVHKVTLKPAHLSYKCTVCTATFTLYRLFESHVYNVHSGSAKRSAEDSSSASEPAAKKLAVVDTGPRKCKDCGIVTENMHDHLVKLHLKECVVKLCRIEKCEKCLYSSDEMLVIRMSDFGLDDELDDSDEDSSEEDSSDENENKSDSSAKKKEEADEDSSVQLIKESSEKSDLNDDKSVIEIEDEPVAS